MCVCVCVLDGTITTEAHICSHKSDPRDIFILRELVQLINFYCLHTQLCYYTIEAASQSVFTLYWIQRTNYPLYWQEVRRSLC